MSSLSSWQFDEFKHAGVDFSDSAQVQTYDARQGTGLADERRLIRRLGISKGDHIIEFGPGTGVFVLAAAEVGAYVTAVDISEEMLAYGHAKAVEMNLGNATFAQSGFLSYQHQGAPVDYVVTKFALHHLPDFWKAIALHRINMLLKVSGIFYLQDVIFSFKSHEHEHSLNQWIETVANDDDSSFSRSDFEMHIREEYSTFSWIIEGMLEREGFTIQESNYRTSTYADYICIKDKE